MSKISNFLSTDPYVDFYEVTDTNGIAIWGGGDPVEAIEFFRQSIGSRLFVTSWNEEGDDAKLIGVPIEITKLITATISNSMERAQQWR